jgi:hypothetical protein
MLEQAHGLALYNLRHHVAQHGADGIEAFVRLADVREAHVVEQNLLHDEDGHRLGELAARLHDAQTERDNLGAEQEGNDVGIVVLLDQRANDAQRRQAQILKRPRLGRRVEKGIEKERNVRCKGGETGKGVS